MCFLCSGGGSEQLSELKNSGLPGEEKSAKRAKLHSRLASWSPKGKRVGGVVMLSGKDRVAEDPFEALASHWSPVFNNARGNGRAVTDLPKHVARCPDGIGPVTKDVVFWKFGKSEDGQLQDPMAFRT